MEELGFLLLVAFWCFSNHFSHINSFFFESTCYCFEPFWSKTPHSDKTFVQTLIPVTLASTVSFNMIIGDCTVEVRPHIYF